MPRTSRDHESISLKDPVCHQMGVNHSHCKHAFQGTAPHSLSQKARAVLLPFLQCVSGQCQCVAKPLPLIHRTGTCDPYLLSHLPDLWWPSTASQHGDYYLESLLLLLDHQLARIPKLGPGR